MEKEHLHLLIHEEIFLLPQDKIAEEETVNEEKEVQESTAVAEPEAELIVKPEEAKADPDTETKDIPEEELKQESPEIPVKEVEEPTEIPLAIFHSSTNEAEIELLQKIIDACKVPADEYKIFGNGFDQSVQFKKALVFVPEAKSFYTPIPYKGSQFLCSKPLSILAADKNEKAKLWGALQKFLP